MTFYSSLLGWSKPHIRKLTTLSLITKLQFILLVIRTPQHILRTSCYDTAPTGYTLSYVLQTTHATSFETPTPCMRCCKDYYQWQYCKAKLYWALPNQMQGLTPIVSELPSNIFCEIIIIRPRTAIPSDESDTKGMSYQYLCSHAGIWLTDQHQERRQHLSQVC